MHFLLKEDLSFNFAAETAQRFQRITMLLTPAILNTSLELLARQAVEGFIIGLHKSPFHGFSVEFAEHRTYNPGDALRHVDWRVYGRTERLFVKRFEEETNLRCCVLVDTSASMHYPVGDAARVSKLQFSCVGAAAILHLLKKQLDAVALGLFAQGIDYLSECRSSGTHHRLLNTELERVLEAPSQPGDTRVAPALHEIAERMHRRSLVVIFSDMMDGSEDLDALFAGLQHLRYNKHEVILFQVHDGQHELALDFQNRPYEFVDMETGDRLKLQPQQVREQYVARMSAFQQEVENRCHQYGIDRELVDLSQPVEAVLHSFLLKRNRLL